MRRKKQTERIEARVPQELHEWATEEAKRRGCSVSEMVRKGLEMLRQLSQGPASRAWVTIVVLHYWLLTYMLLDIMDDGVLNFSVRLLRVF